jgi:O-methyltransferase involved in polyketide biosynthesis
MLIAASLVLLHSDPNHSGIVSPVSAEVCKKVLELYSWRTQLLAKMVRRRWFRTIAKVTERLTVPGILLHYALRKKCLTKLAREALANGATQVVILGAGFDPLAAELCQEFHAAQFWEIDHPATQAHKTKRLAQAGFNSSQPTFWIAEGLLMYLPAPKVKSLFSDAERVSAPGSQFAFTFMEKRSDGRICFQGQTRLADCWLSHRSEPFVWGSARNELSEFVQPWKVLRLFDQDGLREASLVSSDMRAAAGEVICVAQV